MPYVGATLAEAAQQFCNVLNRVINTTVTHARLVAVGPKGEPNARRQVAFRQGGAPLDAQLSTRYGPMGLYIGQVCDSVATSERRRFITVSYRYTLTPDGANEPLLRWEYEREREGVWCRHHLQGPVPLAVGWRSTVFLNDIHLPTGYVTMEEVLRFCIVDLEVPPLSGDWDTILTASYERFKVEANDPPVH